MDVYSGVRWSAVATYGGQAVQLVTSIALARLLAPEYFGLLAMAQVFVGFAGTFSTMGFSQAIVQRKRITEELLSSLFFVTLAVGCLIAMVLACASPVFAWIYRSAEVTPIIATLSLTFILQAPCLVPAALLTRRLAFNRLAVIEISMAMLMAAAAITLAWFGWGVWALVWPTVAGPLIRMPMLYVASGWRPRPLFRWSEVRSVLNFGANLTAFSVLNYFASRSATFVIGAFLGATPLGYYSLAYGILLRPRDAVTSVLGRVLFPAFSRMQDDDTRLKVAYLRACGAIAFITFPLMLGMLVVARPFVEVVLGPKWLPAVPLICVLAPIGALLSIVSTVGQLFLAKGRADWMLRWEVFAALLRISAVLIGVRWGVFGVVVSSALALCVLSIPSFWVVFKLVDGLSLRDLFATLMPYTLSAGTMALLVAFSRIALETIQVEPAIILLTSVSLGVAIYAAIVLWARPAALHDLGRLLPGWWGQLFVRVMRLETR
jgi:PST family polysaccharide transporter